MNQVNAAPVTEIPEFFEDLDRALTVVATRSFGEHTEIRPVLSSTGAVTGYLVFDSHEQFGDDVTWTAGTSVQHHDHITESTRLMDTAEMVDTAFLVRRFLPESVEALEAGQTVVHFGYVTVDLDSDSHEEYDPEDDNTVGWALHAIHMQHDA